MKALFLRLFSFSGREGRLNYLLAAWVVPFFVVLLVTQAGIFALDLLLVGITALLVAAFTARRLHDLNFSAWWVLTTCCSATFFSYSSYWLEILPVWFLVICVLMSAVGNLYLLVVPGKKTPNRFGDRRKKKCEVQKCEIS